MTRQRLARTLWIVVALWAVFILLSLHFGWLDAFFFDASHAHVQGIDFFPVERGWLNLLAGRSEFDTFHSGYGPYATWLVYHPALAVIVGPSLMAFKPWTAYAMWSVISMGLMVLSAFFILQRGTVSRGTDDLRRPLVVLLFLGFPTALMLYVGNVQAVLVLSCALLFAALDSMAADGVTRRNERMLLAGLLLSLFSKPIVFAMLPLFLLLQQTRRSALRSLGIYMVVSLIFLAMPALNPVALSWGQRWFLAMHPEIVAQTMNPFTNGFIVTVPMQDNAIHWLAMAGAHPTRSTRSHPSSCSSSRSSSSLSATARPGWKPRSTPPWPPRCCSSSATASYGSTTSRQSFPSRACSSCVAFAASSTLQSSASAFSSGCPASTWCSATAILLR
jgi:hypothetical protein